jgi:glucan phosphoethanolaminetransferase (alkaline phosphatase superfamily)
VESRSARLRRALLGDEPKRLLPLLAPTVAALALDVVLRGALLAGFRPAGKAIYVSSLLVSAALWFFPLWVAARYWQTRRKAVVLFFALFVLPIMTFGYGGQALYFHVFHGYVGRDTVRLGIALRGTVGGWLVSWGSPTRFFLVVAFGGLLTLGVVLLVRRVAPAVKGRPPVLAVLTFVAALACLSVIEGVDSRYLQASLPDVCFAHGATHAFVSALSGDLRARQGMAVRTPAALPPLTRGRERPVNVIVVLTESVRTDAMCSAAPPLCVSPMLDEVASDRIPLGRLTTQAPNTFTACMILWTGLAPNTDFKTAHTAPVLWEVARAVGYRTAYVTSQNASYENFSSFVQNAGIDLLKTAGDLGGMEQEHIGAPDERACEQGLRFAREAGSAPFFAVVHLSNTHAPYRTTPELRPFTPDSDDPLGDTTLFHNRYKNAVRFQERTIASMIRELRRLPSWDDTAVVVLSDHGEQFNEHGAIYHNHSLYEQELRVPGWLVAGPRVLADEERASLAAYARSRTYSQDVHATIVDLLGVDRRALPFDDPAARSLLVPRARDEGEPFALMATTSAVWEPDLPIIGAMLGEHKVFGPQGGGAQAFTCVDVLRHPSEVVPTVEPWCGPMVDRVIAAFAPHSDLPGSGGKGRGERD